MRPTLSAASFAALLAAGCAGAPAEGPQLVPSDGKADGVASATLSFQSDFSTTQSGTVTAGGHLTVRYDLDRLPDCRGGNDDGSPAWTVTGNLQVDDGDVQTFDVSRVVGTDRVAQPAELTVPAGKDLQLWFDVTNRWGCIAWDSNQSQNYHFTVAPAAADLPTITFGSDGSVAADGALHAGGKVRVRYALDRLTTCRGTQAHYAQWSITGYASVDGSAPLGFEVSRPDGDGGRVPSDTVLALPAHGHDLELWFQNTNRWGCSAWDSANGANYRFAIE